MPYSSIFRQSVVSPNLNRETTLYTLCSTVTYSTLHGVENSPQLATAKNSQWKSCRQLEHPFLHRVKSRRQAAHSFLHHVKSCRRLEQPFLHHRVKPSPADDKKKLAVEQLFPVDGNQKLAAEQLFSVDGKKKLAVEQLSPANDKKLPAVEQLSLMNANVSFFEKKNEFVVFEKKVIPLSLERQPKA